MFHNCPFAKLFSHHPPQHSRSYLHHHHQRVVSRWSRAKSIVGVQTLRIDSGQPTNRQAVAWKSKATAISSIRRTLLVVLTLAENCEMLAHVLRSFGSDLPDKWNLLIVQWHVESASRGGGWVPSSGWLLLGGEPCAFPSYGWREQRTLFRWQERFKKRLIWCQNDIVNCHFSCQRVNQCATAAKGEFW